MKKGKISNNINYPKKGKRAKLDKVGKEWAKIRGKVVKMSGMNQLMLPQTLGTLAFLVYQVFDFQNSKVCKILLI